MPPGSFDLFIGVDWSGAKGPSLPGFKVAVCRPGDGGPNLVPGPTGKHWTRSLFADWLLDQIGQGQRVLCGMDFSFCFPWCDHQAYFPDGAKEPQDWFSFWQLVEAVCALEDTYYAGRFAQQTDLQAYFAVTGHVGGAYERRLRVTETACQDQGLGTPESVFNLRGARQVGKSSLSGMLVLHHLRQQGDIAVWPFDDPTDAQSVLIETFPTAFVRMAGAGRGKIRDQGRLQDVLGHFQASPANLPGQLNDDEADALVTAAALRYLSQQSDLWQPVALSDRVRRYEGWTFGVR